MRGLIEAEGRTVASCDAMFKLLDPAKTELRFNGEWMDKFTAADFVRLCAKTTVKQILERDDFTKRMADEKPISLHELLYPLMQGHDSVEVRAERLAAQLKALGEVEHVDRHRVDVGPEPVLDVLAGLFEVFHLQLDGGHLAAC